MHKFLRAIGFSDITKKDLEILIEGIKEKPEIMKVTTDSEGNELPYDYEIETYEDHRAAMAFTLPGLRTGNIVIKNPGCCAGLPLQRMR